MGDQTWLLIVGCLVVGFLGGATFIWALSTDRLRSVYSLIVRASAEQNIPEIEEFVASGIGVGADGALKNALRNAVQKAVALVVSAETLARNEEIVRDQILADSDRYVARYSTIREQRKGDEIYAVDIEAHVWKRKLVEKLKEAHIIIGRFGNSALG